MKLSQNWLKEFVNVDLSVEDLAHKLTMAGVEIEDIETIDGDVVYDMEITPNRPDCLSIIGLSREVAAVTGNPLNNLQIKEPILPEKKVDITIEAPEACTRYAGALIEGVDIQSSPENILSKFKSMGMTPISNVVDVTNYCLMELGQPMHAFDYDKLAGGKIIVRWAKDGEKIITLDGEEKELDPSILVIADAEKPVAIAGVKGGKSAEVTTETKNILLESACFDHVLVRRTCRKVKISTDSSYRFERGVDFPTVRSGVFRALAMIQELAGGTFTAFHDSEEKNVFEQKKLAVSLKDIEKYLGAEVGSENFESMMKSLDFDLNSKDQNHYEITVPSFRKDVHEMVDLVEETARVIGYDHLPTSLPNIGMLNISTADIVSFRHQLRKNCMAQGLDEVVTFSMTHSDSFEKSKIDLDDNVVEIKNPLSQEQRYMRTSLLPSFLQVAHSNVRKFQKHLRLFEIGKVYGQKKEVPTLGILLLGSDDKEWRNQRKSEYDFYDLKGILENILTGLDFCPTEFFYSKENIPEAYHPNQSATIQLKGKEIGVIGEIDSQILKEWDLKFIKAFFLEVDLQSFIEKEQTERMFEEISEFPAMTQDISLEVQDDVSFQNIRDVVSQEKSKILTDDVVFLDEYRGDNVKDGFKALTFSLTYQSKSRTLKDEEVKEVHARVVESLLSQLNAKQR